MPLRKAVLCGKTDVVEFLLESGYLPHEGDCLLHLLATQSEEINRIRIAQLLLPHCPIDERDIDGNTPLHLAEDIEFAHFLIKEGAAVDLKNSDGKLPYEVAATLEVSDFLEKEYRKLHPIVEVIKNADETLENSVAATDWANRFSTQLVTIQDLIPADDNSNGKDWSLSYLGQEFKTSNRFVSSLAKKLKFSSNIFKYFSPSEVLERVAEQNSDYRFQVTFDHHSKQILGVVDEDKKFLPPAIACKVFADDPRVRSISYDKGIWSADLHLDEVFNVPKSGEYFRRFNICYPVDGVGMPCIYLSMMRQVCSNGSTARVAEFRTDIEINDESGLHLSRLLSSFNNQYGFTALEDRLGIAQSTTASVRELMEIDSLLQNHVADKHAYRLLHNRLDEIAGEPCFRYGTTSLNNIPAKKRALLPVDCSVNDLLNFSSELTSHHGNLLNNAVSFDVATGKMLAHEFDLEGMYSRRSQSPNFFLKNLDLPSTRTRESFEREESMEFIDV